MVRKSAQSGRDGLGRSKHVRVRTARGRKSSSTRWLKRQLNDPFVREAQRLGYRSRAAFKIIELHERFGFLKKAARVVDLGAAPGGWSQIAAKHVGNDGIVVALDVNSMEPLAGVTALEGDFYDDHILDSLIDIIGGKADVVLSDMAAPATGHPNTDHLRIIGLAEAAYDFARSVLATDGTFVTKVFQGGTEQDLLALLKRDFRKVAHAKPKSSRKESAELYLVASGFRG